MNKKIRQFVYDNSDIIIKFLLCYIIGIVIGFCILNFSGAKEEYIEDINSILINITSDNFNTINIISNGIKNNFILIIISYLSLLTTISPIILLSVFMIKAISNSIYTFSIFKLFGIGKGITFFMICNLIPTVIGIVSYILLSINIIHAFFDIKNSKKVPFSGIFRHAFLLTICISLMCFSLVFEQVLVSFFINLYSSI